MKTLTILLMSGIWFCAAGQIIEYRYYNNKLYGVDSSGNFIKIPHIEYGKNEPMPGRIEGYKVPENYTPPTIGVNHAVRINKAGRLLISSAAILLAGGAVSVAGVISDSPETVYIGAGMSATSIFTMLAAGVQLMKFKFPKSDMQVNANGLKLHF